MAKKINEQAKKVLDNIAKDILEKYWDQELPVKLSTFSEFTQKLDVGIPITTFTTPDGSLRFNILSYIMGKYLSDNPELTSSLFSKNYTILGMYLAYSLLVPKEALVAYREISNFSDEQLKKLFLAPINIFD